MIKYGKESFDDLIKKGNVLVEFYTDSCIPCKLMEDELLKIEDKISIIKIDALENRNLTKKYGIMSVPTLVYFDKKGKIEIKKSYMSSDDILKWILR